MNEQRRIGAKLYAQLTHCLQEGLRFDVTNRSAYLYQGDVCVTGSGDHSALNLVGDMGDHLNGST